MSSSSASATSDVLITDGEPHVVKASTKGGQVALKVDEGKWVKGAGGGGSNQTITKTTLTKKGSGIFVGGHPDVGSGFRGCIHAVWLGGHKVEIREDAVAAGNVRQCGGKGVIVHDDDDDDYPDTFYSALLRDDADGFDEDQYLERINREKAVRRRRRMRRRGRLGTGSGRVKRRRRRRRGGRRPE